MLWWWMDMQNLGTSRVGYDGYRNVGNYKEVVRHDHRTTRQESLRPGSEPP
jgi:hypothetical protein